MGNLMNRIVHVKAKPSDKVTQILYSQFRKINLDTSLGRVSRILEKDPFVLVVHSQRQCNFLNTLRIYRDIFENIFITKTFFKCCFKHDILFI